LSGNGAIFCLSSIRKASHILDGFDFLFYANDHLTVYLLNLNFGQPIDNFDGKTKVDSDQMNAYLQ